MFFVVVRFRLVASDVIRRMMERGVQVLGVFGPDLASELLLRGFEGMRPPTSIVQSRIEGNPCEIMAARYVVSAHRRLRHHRHDW